MKIRFVIGILALALSSSCFSQEKASESQFFVQLSASRTYIEPETIRTKLQLKDSVGVIKVDDWFKYFVGGFVSSDEAFAYMQANHIDGFITRYTRGEFIAPIVNTPPEEDLVRKADTIQLLEKKTVDPDLTEEVVADLAISPVEEVIEVESEELDEIDVFRDDRDSSAYAFVTIGDQIWMANNLNFKTQFGISPQADSIPGSEAGLLYDYQDAVNVCPAGWHLPSEKEWMELEKYLGVENNELRSMGHHSSGGLGDILKSTYGWMSDGNGSDVIGFNALPAGMASKKGKQKQNNVASYYWSNSKSVFGIWIRRFQSNSSGINRTLASPHSFLSVRCVKDNPEM